MAATRNKETFTFKRSERFNRVLREELVNLITKEIRDPRIAGVTLTEVRTSEDLSAARVYYTSPLDDTEQHQAIQKGLTNAVGFLRGELGRRLHVKRIPQLSFIRDRSIENGARIDDLLRDIHTETEETSDHDDDGQSS